MDTALHFLSWAVRILIAAGCFGLMSLKSMPRIMANSRDAVHFWRFRKQAESDLQKVRRWTIPYTSNYSGTSLKGHSEIRTPLYSGHFAVTQMCFLNRNLPLI